MFSLNSNQNTQTITKVQYRQLITNPVTGTLQTRPVTGVNDAAITQAQSYANLASSRFSSIVYKAPAIKGNVYTFNDPIFNGHVTVQGNIDIIPSLSNVVGTGFVNVIHDVKVAGSVYAQDVIINGSIQFPNNLGFSFVGNTRAPYLSTVVENAGAIYINEQAPITHLVLANQVIYFATNGGITGYAPSINGPGQAPFYNSNAFIANRAANAVWNGFYWVAVGYGQHSIATAQVSDLTKWTGVQPIGGYAPGIFEALTNKVGGAYGLVWNGTQWITGGYGSKFCLAASPDGTAWTGIPFSAVPIGGSLYCTNIGWNGQVYVSSWMDQNRFSDQPEPPTYSLAYSYDGVAWVTADAGSPSPLLPLGAVTVVWNGAYWLAAGGGYSASGNNLARSYDGVNWTTYRSDVLNGVINVLAWNGDQNLWVAGVGDTVHPCSNSIAYSVDGVHWTGLGLQIFAACTGVTWDGTQWCAVGSPNTSLTGAVVSSKFQYSFDAKVWFSNNVSRIDNTPLSIITTYGSTGFAVINDQLTVNRSVTVGKNLAVRGGVASVSPVTGAVVVQGGIGVSGSANLGGNITVASTETGALMVAGGAGLGGSLAVAGSASLGGSLAVGGGASLGTNLTVGGNLTVGSTVDTQGVGSGAGAFVVAGGATVGRTLAVGNTLVVGGTTDTAGLGSGTLVVAGGASLTKSVIIGNSLMLGGTTDTSGASTGTLVVAGGASLAKNVLIGNSLTVTRNLVVQGNTDSLTTGTGTVVITGGVGVGQSMVVGNSVTVEGQTDTGGLGSMTGALVVAGGVTVGQSTTIGNTLTIGGTSDPLVDGNMALQVAGGVNIDGSITVAGPLVQINSEDVDPLTLNPTTTTNPALYVAGGTQVGLNLNVGRGIHIFGHDRADSTSPDTGALVVDGGAGVAQTLNVGGRATVGSTMDTTGLGSGALTVAGGASLTKSLLVGGTTTVMSTTETTGTGTGALVVTGGVSLTKSLFVGANLTVRGNTDSTTVTTGALTVAGGVGVTKSLCLGGNLAVGSHTTVGGNTSLAGNLTVGGNTTLAGNLTVPSVASFYVGNILLNRLLPGTLFQGIDTSFSQQVSIQGTGSGALTVTGGGRFGGNLYVGNQVVVAANTAATSVTSGALVVGGGVGIGGDVWINGNLAVNKFLYQDICGHNVYVGSSDGNDFIALLVGATNRHNTIMGYNAFYESTGSSNTTVGYGALTFNNSGNYNTALGGDTLLGLYPTGSTNPDYNTAVGYQAGSTVGGSSNYGGYNTFLGANTIVGGPYDHSTAIGYGATITASRQIVIGTVDETVTIPGQFSVPGGFTLGTQTATDTQSTGVGTLVVYGGASTTGNSVVGNTLMVLGQGDGALLVTGGATLGGNLVAQQGLTVAGTGAGALTVTGGVGIGGNTVLAGNLMVTSPVNTITPSTGAVTVTGGVGIGANLVVGGNTHIYQGLYVDQFTDLSGSVLVTGVTNLVGNTTATGNLTVAGNLGVVGSSTVVGKSTTSGRMDVSGVLDVSGTTNIHGTLTVTGSSRVDGDFLVNGDTVQNGSLIFADGPTLTPTYDAFNTLTISSGINLEGTLNIVNGGTLQMAGSQIVVGGFVVPDISNAVNFLATQDAYSTSMGTITCHGGVGIAKNIYLGGNLVAGGTVTGANTTISGNTTSTLVRVTGNTAATSSNTGALTVVGGVGIGGNLVVDGSGACLRVTSTNPGAVQVTGGASIGANLVVGNTLTVVGSGSRALSIPTGGAYVGGNVLVGTGLSVQGGKPATSTATGALTVVGGAGVSGNLVVGGSILALGTNNTMITSSISTLTSNAIYAVSTPNRLTLGMDNCGNFLVSTVDGSWNLVSSNGLFASGTAIQWNGFIWVAGCVATAANGYTTLLYSYNGVGWVASGYPGFGHTGGVTSVTWSGATWVATGYNRDNFYNFHSVAWSSDGITWTEGGGVTLNRARCAAYNGSQWIVGGTRTNKNTDGTANNTYALMTSPDGMYWTPIPSLLDVASTVYGVATTGNTWVAIGDRRYSGPGATLIYSHNGMDWTDVSFSENIFAENGYGGVIAANGSIWVAGGGYPAILAYSYDGATWYNGLYGGDTFLDSGNSTINTLGISSQYSVVSVLWNNDRLLWYASVYHTNGPGAFLLSSSNGVNWTQAMGVPDFDITGEVYCQALACTGTNTGKLFVKSTATVGSINVTQNGYVSGSLYVSGNIYYNNTIPAGSGGGANTITATTDASFGANVYIHQTTPAVDISSGALIVSGGAAVGGNVFMGANLWVGGAAVTILGNTGLGGNLVVGGAMGLGGTLAVGGVVTIGNTLASSGTGSGALTVAGGMGLAGNLVVGGPVAIGNTLVSSGTGSGALTVAGGMGLGGDLYTGGWVTVGNTTPATGPSTGAFQVKGGSSIAGNLFTGGSLTVLGTVSTGATSISGTLTAGSATFTGSTTIYGTVSSGPITTGSATISGGLTAGSVSTGGLTATGSATISGGLTTGSATVAGALTAGSVSTSGALTAGSATVAGALTAGSVSTSGALTAGSTSVTGTSTLGGQVVINSTFPSFGPSTGALVVAGGAGIRGNLYVGGNIYMNGVMVGTGGSISTGSTVNAGVTTVTTLNVNTNINTGLIQYYPMDVSLSNYASGFPVYDVSYGTSLPLLSGASAEGKGSSNILLVPSTSNYTDIIDPTGMGLYYTFEHTSLILSRPNFGATNEALFSTNVAYMSNGVAITIPTAFTLSFWISLTGYYPTTGKASIFNVTAGATPITLDITATGNLVNSAGQTTNYQLPSTPWVYVAWVYTPGTSILYINGVPAVAGPANLSALGATGLVCRPGSVFIGNNPSAGYVQQFSYEMQQYRLYGRALSAVDISNLWQNTGTYYNQPVIPATAVGVVTGDLGVAGNTIITQNLGVGLNNPQYTVDICGNLNVRGTVSASNATQLTYTSLPTLTSYQVGYTSYGVFTGGVAITTGTVVSLTSITVPMGVWMFNAQGVFQATTGSAVNVTTAILSLGGSATQIQPAALAAATNIPPYGFSQLYLTGGASLGLGQNVQNNYYSTNITQVLNLGAATTTVYLNTLFVGATVACDISSSYFSATRLA